MDSKSKWSATKSARKGAHDASQARGPRIVATSCVTRIAGIKNTRPLSLRLDGRDAQSHPHLVPLERMRVRDGNATQSAKTKSPRKESQSVVNHRRQQFSPQGALGPWHGTSRQRGRNRSRVCCRRRALFRTRARSSLDQTASRYDSQHDANHDYARMGWPIGFPNPLPECFVVLTERRSESKSALPSIQETSGFHAARLTHG